MRKFICAAILAISIANVGSGLDQTPVQEKEWARYTPDKCGLSVELLGKPEPVDQPLPEELVGSMHYLNMYLSRSGKIFTLVEHTSSTEPLPPKSLAEGVVKGIIKAATITDLNYSTEPSTETQAPIKGSYKQNGVVLEINGIALTQQKHSWIVVSIYVQSNAEDTKAAARILASIKMDGGGCPEKKTTTP